jgi:glycosyltransferase involved in cell wall biosynthesis
VNSPKQHIVILGTAYPLRGGLAAFNERLARAFQERGYRVTIVTFSLQYPGFLFPGDTQYDTGPAPPDLHIEIRLNSVNPLSWIRVGRYLRQLRPDLIIAKFWLPFMGPALGTVLRIAKGNGHTRTLSIIDNIIPHEHRPGDRPLARYFANQIDAFIVMSRSVEQDMAGFVTDQPVVYSPHPIYDNFGEKVAKAEARRELGIDPAVPLVLFFGFIRDYKGLDLLLRAMADKHIEARGIQLLVAGEYYGNREKYEALIEELGIRDRLHLHTDFIPNDRVRYYFGAADLVAQPYKTATQSGISQMAYHFEKPMVVTRVGGLPEIVPHGEAGYVVDTEPRAIAAAIVDYFDRDQTALFTAGLLKNKQKYSWDVMLDEVERLAFPSTQTSRS